MGDIISRQAYLGLSAGLLLGSLLFLRLFVCLGLQFELPGGTGRSEFHGISGALSRAHISWHSAHTSEGLYYGNASIRMAEYTQAMLPPTQAMLPLRMWRANAGAAALVHNNLPC